MPQGREVRRRRYCDGHNDALPVGRQRYGGQPACGGLVQQPGGVGVGSHLAKVDQLHAVLRGDDAGKLAFVENTGLHQPLADQRRLARSGVGEGGDHLIPRHEVRIHQPLTEPWAAGMNGQVGRPRRGILVSKDQPNQ